MKRCILGIINIIRGAIGIVLCGTIITGAGFIGLGLILAAPYYPIAFGGAMLWGMGLFYMGFALYATIVGIISAAKGIMGLARVAILIGLTAAEIYIVISSAL